MTETEAFAIDVRDWAQLVELWRTRVDLQESEA